MGNRIVEIKWTGPFTKEVIKANKNGEIPSCRGIYQLCGYHRFYEKGKKTLLYIGMAKNIFERITNHPYRDENWVPYCFYPSEINVRVGRICCNESGVTLSEIEGVLIFMHSPAWNSAKIAGVKNSYKSVEIKNLGSRGDLLKTVEGSRFF